MTALPPPHEDHASVLQILMILVWAIAVIIGLVFIIRDAEAEGPSAGKHLHSPRFQKALPDARL